MRNYTKEKPALSTDILFAQLAEQAKQAVAESLKAVLTKYDSPFNKLVEQSVASHKDQFSALMNKAFDLVLADEDFTKELVDGLRQKIARVLIGKMDGEVEKKINEWKADPQRRAKLTLAIAGILDKM